MPLEKITDQKFVDFVWKNIICCFGIPNNIVSYHGTQFDCAIFNKFCDNFGILKTFSAPAHPQSNSQVEVVNKTIKQTLKKKFSKLKGSWVDKLPLILWSYRMSF